MPDIDVPLIEEKKPNKTQVINWVLYTSLFFSTVAILIGIAGYFKKPVITDNIIYSIPKENVEGNLSIGQVVSLNKEGKLHRGAGTTVTKNVLSWPNEVMSHLHSTAVGHNLVISVYDGFMMITYVNEDGKATYNSRIELPVIGNSAFHPDDITTLDDKTVAVMGNSNVIPFTVSWENDQAIVSWGTAIPFLDKQTIQPEMDKLNSTCIALSYYVGLEDIHIGTRVGCLKGSGSDLQFQFFAENLYSKNYMFHAIAGLSSDTFILAKAVDEKMEDKNIYFQVATVLSDGSISIPRGDGIKLQRSNFGFFDMDNLNDHHIVVTFIDGDLNDGIESVLLVYEKERKRLIVGPFLDHQDGGASGMSEAGVYNFIYVRIMSETRFAVFYSNIMVEGATAVSIAEVTPASDLVAVGPEYIISSKMTDPVGEMFAKWMVFVLTQNNQYYWLGECSPFRNRLILTECLTVKEGSEGHAEMHVIDIMALPLGVVVATSDKQVDVAVSGTISVFTPLEAGRNYYGDSRGDLIMGEYAGLMNTEAFYIYVENENEIVSDDNRVGMAIDSHTLFIKQDK